MTKIVSILLLIKENSVKKVTADFAEMFVVAKRI